MIHRITVLPQKVHIEAETGDNLQEVLRRAGFPVPGVCGGNGTCGKCGVSVNGELTLACHTRISTDLTVVLPETESPHVLTRGIDEKLGRDGGIALAIDIGTTTVAAYLLKDGVLLATESAANPQAAYGADVVSRLQYARRHGAHALTAAIRDCASSLTRSLLTKTGKPRLDTVCMVGNSAMVQLFLGLDTENLLSPPFTPCLRQTQILPAGQFLPDWQGAEFLAVPHISGYIGSDTVACILATGMDKTEKMTLLVDIGTNGEMVLGNGDMLVACATAAGPALEGAGIQFGMQAVSGAIDRVSPDFTCHTIGGGKARGICGSGLVDAVAAALDAGLLNSRGKILSENPVISLSDGVCLTQQDIRQFQQAKGAIAAGIRSMAAGLGIGLEEIEEVYLAGAFGTFLDPHAACRTGLLPPELESKIRPIGNAAGSGGKIMACSGQAFVHSQKIADSVTHLDLARQKDWAKTFAKSMAFDTPEDYWQARALDFGFTHSARLDPGVLTPRADVRAMCAADKCRAYGKNHTCPPYCGTLETCQEKMRRFRRGILVQTVGKTEKTVDTKAYRRTEEAHLANFYRLCEEIKKYHPQALCLGSGGCRICGSCAWPEPCRHPDIACPSMEGYGLFVTDVCRAGGLAYHHGERTITYTACVLF